jgi:hypothetical protein
MASNDPHAPCACTGPAPCACAAPASPKLTWALVGKTKRLVPEGTGVLQLDVSAKAWRVARAGFDDEQAPAVYAAVAEVLLGAVASRGEWTFSLTPSSAPRLVTGGAVTELWRLRHTLGEQVEWLLMGGSYAAPPATTPR